MLVIRPQQMKRFEENLIDQFIDRSARYVEERWKPAAARYPDGAALRAFVAACVKRGMDHGFREEGHLMKLLDWECQFGEGYLDEPRWEWLKSIYEGAMNPASRIYRIERRIGILRERGEL